MTNLIKEAFTGFKSGPYGAFRGFIAAVLVQFSLLSCMGIASQGSIEVLPVLSTLANSMDYWWCFLSLLGAVALTFESKIRDHVWLLLVGYVSAISSLLVLGSDFVLRKPPVYTAATLAVTAAIILGGILYDRIRRTS